MIAFFHFTDSLDEAKEYGTRLPYRNLHFGDTLYVFLILAVNIVHIVYCVKNLDQHLLLLILNSH